MNKVGYETHLVRSDDLLKWEPLGKILSFRESGWDKWQAGGTVAAPGSPVGRLREASDVRWPLLDDLHRRGATRLRDRSALDGHGVDEDA